MEIWEDLMTYIAYESIFEEEERKIFREKREETTSERLPTQKNPPAVDSPAPSASLWIDP